MLNKKDIEKIKSIENSLNRNTIYKEDYDFLHYEILGNIKPIEESMKYYLQVNNIKIDDERFKQYLETKEYIRLIEGILNKRKVIDSNLATKEPSVYDFFNEGIKEEVIKKIQDTCKSFNYVDIAITIYLLQSVFEIVTISPTVTGRTRKSFAKILKPNYNASNMSSVNRKFITNTDNLNDERYTDEQFDRVKLLIEKCFQKI